MQGRGGLPPPSPGPGQRGWIHPADDGVDGAKMELFKECWKRHNNDERTSTKDA